MSVRINYKTINVLLTSSLLVEKAFKLGVKNHPHFSVLMEGFATFYKKYLTINC